MEDPWGTLEGQCSVGLGACSRARMHAAAGKLARSTSPASHDDRITGTWQVDHARSSRRRRGHRDRWADEPVGSRRGGWSVCGSLPRSPALPRGSVESELLVLTPLPPRSVLWCLPLVEAVYVEYGRESDHYVDYAKGANVAGFKKVADAMLAYGVV